LTRALPENAPRITPVAVLKAADLPVAAHFAVWHSIWRGRLNVAPLQQPWRFNSDIEFAQAGRIFFMKSSVSALRWQSLPGPSARSDRPLVMLLLMLSGKATLVMSDGFTVEASPDEVLVQSLDVPFTTFTSPHEALLLLLPAAFLQAQPMLRKVPAMSWPVHTAPGLLFVSTLKQVFAALPGMSERELAAAGAGLVGLLDGVMASDPRLVSSQYREPTRLPVMQRHILANLRQSDLGIEALCRHFYCSRATLYRLFEAEGGVAAYITKLRLDRCMLELANLQQPTSGLIDAMAKAWGFASTPSFVQKFHRRFGLRPQEVGAAVVSQSASDYRLKGGVGRDVERIKAWLDRL
jgi:AraC-like DNA-binding protein